MFMGSNLVELSDILFDTTQSWLAFETTDCTDCYVSYDTSENSATYNSLPSSDMSLTVMGSSEVSGSTSIDWVCLTNDSNACATDMPWMNVETTGLGDSLNGVMGLCAEPTGPNFL